MLRACVFRRANTHTLSLSLSPPPTPTPPPHPSISGFLVTNTKHLYHHERDVTKFMSAPILDLDRPLGLKRAGKK
jgi:hypothetical protein